MLRAFGLLSVLTFYAASGVTASWCAYAWRRCDLWHWRAWVAVWDAMLGDGHCEEQARKW